MKFSIGKKYKTKCGNIVKVIRLDEDNPHNVIINLRNHELSVHFGNLKNNMYMSPLYRKYHGVGYVGFIDIHENKELFDIWIRMINKCHGQKIKSAIMCKRWESYKKFHDWYIGHYNPVYHRRFKRILDTAKIYNEERIEFQFAVFIDMVERARKNASL